MYIITRAPRGTDRSPEYNEQLEKALTDLFNAPPVMYASRIYVTGLVPCLVNAVDFLLYKLHVFRAAVIYPSLRESLYFSQDNWSGRFLHLTRPHKV